MVAIASPFFKHKKHETESTIAMTHLLIKIAFFHYTLGLVWCLYDPYGTACFYLPHSLAVPAEQMEPLLYTIQFVLVGFYALLSSTFLRLWVRGKPLVPASVCQMMCAFAACLLASDVRSVVRYGVEPLSTRTADMSIHLGLLLVYGYAYYQTRQSPKLRRRTVVIGRGLNEEERGTKYA